MSLDATLRQLERRAARGEHVPDEERIAALLRAGVPDPRWDPTPGAVVQVPGRRVPVRREVAGLWPKVLLRERLVRPFWAREMQWPIDASDTLPAGTLVLACAVYERFEATPITWRLTAMFRGEYIEWLSYAEPELVGDTVREGLPLEVVEWSRGWASDAPTARSTLDAWRRWARGGAVLRLGRTRVGDTTPGETACPR